MGVRLSLSRIPNAFLSGICLFGSLPFVRVGRHFNISSVTSQSLREDAKGYSCLNNLRLSACTHRWESRVLTVRVILLPDMRESEITELHFPIRCDETRAGFGITNGLPHPRHLYGFGEREINFGGRRQGNHG